MPQALACCPDCSGEGSHLVDASIPYRDDTDEFGTWEVEVMQDEEPCATCQGTGSVSVARRTQLLVDRDRTRTRARPSLAA